MSVCLFAGCISTFRFALQPQDVENPGVNHLFQCFQTGGSDGCLTVCQLVDDARHVKQVADDDGGVEVVVHGGGALLVHLFGVSLCQ